MARRLKKRAGAPLFDAATPKGGSAVMASRQVTADDDADYFPTPPWAARAVGELIKALDPAATSCWEPACGEGHMVAGLADYFAQIRATDLHHYGCEHQTGALDFLSEAADYGPPADWIVSNPPFKLGEAFVRAAWKRARRGVAMLLRLQFVEGQDRHRLFTQDCPLTVLAQFSERVPMFSGRWDPDRGSATAYAVFIFTKPDLVRPALSPVVVFIPPGTKARLSKPEDIVRFAPLTIAYCETAALAAAAEGDADKAADLTEVADRMRKHLAAATRPSLFDRGAA